LGKEEEFIVMVELGGLREGIPPEQPPTLINEIFLQKSARIVGLATNHVYNLGTLPNEQNMARFVNFTGLIEAQIGEKLRYISTGNSSALPILLAGKLLDIVNHLHLGEVLF
jgi:predicted amino acid racemase